MADIEANPSHTQRDEYLKQRNAARLAAAERIIERDEARAEVARLTKERDEARKLADERAEDRSEIWRDRAAISAALATATARTEALEAEVERKRVCLDHICAILNKKRCSNDSTFHAGSTSFKSLERWAYEGLDTAALLATRPPAATPAEGKQ